MIELVDSSPNVDVRPAEYNRLLGFPRNHTLEGRAKDLAEAARNWYVTHGETLDLRSARIGDANLWQGDSV